MQKKNKTAFTLAEVLLTLAIIGIVAAILIPIVIANSQNIEFSSRLQKSFSTISSGLKLHLLNTGCSDLECSGILDSDANAFMTNLSNANIFNIQKKCDVFEKGCHDKRVKYLNNNLAWITNDEYALMVLTDGTVWGVKWISPICNVINGTGRLAKSCTVQTTFIDVNGEQPPNVFGRDIYRFYLLKDGSIVPVGTDNDTRMSPWNDLANEYSCLSGGDGETCAARVLQEGTINY